MNIFRKILVRAATPLLSVLLLSSLTLVSLNINFSRPDNLKKWLAESKVFEAVVPTIVAQSKQKGAGEDANLSRPEVQTALEKSISPQFLQTATNNILDGSYDWLEGKSSKPTYNVDLTPVKSAFGSNLGDQARLRLASLPLCNLSRPPISNDPFTTNCRPPDAATEAQIQKLVSDVTGGDDFLAYDHLTADTPSTSPASATTLGQPTTVPWYQQASSLPKLYHWAQIGPWVLGSLALVMALIIVFASPTKRRGARNLIWTVFSAGLLLTVSAGLTLWLAGHVNFINSAETAAMHQPLVTFMKLVAASASRPLLISGILLLSCAVIGLIVLRQTRPPAAPETKLGHPNLPPPPSA